MTGLKVFLVLSALIWWITFWVVRGAERNWPIAFCMVMGIALPAGVAIELAIRYGK